MGAAVCGLLPALQFFFFPFVGARHGESPVCSFLLVQQQKTMSSLENGLLSKSQSHDLLCSCCPSWLLASHPLGTPRGMEAGSSISPRRQLVKESLRQGRGHTTPAPTRRLREGGVPTGVAGPGLRVPERQAACGRSRGSRHFPACFLGFSVKADVADGPPWREKPNSISTHWSPQQADSGCGRSAFWKSFSLWVRNSVNVRVCVHLL